MNVSDLIATYLIQKTPVFIHYNKEGDQWLYSVEVVGSNGFWLASFETEAAAREYADRYQLPLQEQPQ